MARKQMPSLQHKVLDDLIRISNITGRDAALVQGGGGNTSVKTDDGKYMYIKASGTALKDMNEREGWRRQRLDRVLNVIRDDGLAKLEETAREIEVVRRLLEACEDDITGGARPSVESHLHGLLDKYVIHLHPLVIGAYVNARNGKAQLEKLFKEEKYPPLWVPYTDPGYQLARRIAQLIGQYENVYGRKPAVMILAKHGLFVTAKSADAALRLVRKVIKLCGSNLPLPKARVPKAPSEDEVLTAKLAIRKAVFEATGRYMPVSYFMINAPVAAFIKRKDAPKLLATPALNPDELVYANGSALWLERYDVKTITRKLKSLINRGQKPSAAFVIKGLGLFVAADKKTADLIAEITTGSLSVRMHAARFGGVLALTRREQNFINSWEAESFRKGLVSTAIAGELKDRIAVVTGAGSGLGRSIAIGLARAGAIIGVTDIDSDAAEETISIIKKELPEANANPIICDVTNEQSVKESIGIFTNFWGGLDIMVNAAGVAPAEALVDLPVDKWRFALEVNLTGYFLMAQAAARIMIRQRMGGSIINLSSKSGLEASKNNTSYNATKAGEIHMARGWAMELGEYGIRVNCVCPGNVFEGSKIWNPEYIEISAQKYGIRPEEVIPYYVNKTILKREIKGQDIADAIVFLCSDKARTITGQIIVTDGGQVMVR